jgi:hypothetical protein
MWLFYFPFWKFLEAGVELVFERDDTAVVTRKKQGKTIMKQTLFHEKYPIYVLELGKAESSCKSVDDVVAYYWNKIEEHPDAAFIGVFDHYAHSSSLPDGEISGEIKEAKNVLFCFGRDMLSPISLAVRARSIGIAELPNGFIISFLEAPNPIANEAMEGWTLALKDQ